ncbi:MAG: hypothetical protein KGJ78_15225 [Alphaproteobacteria bacterium]|nr:hypothetical protein [Alphaproteobacteria bacterium]
MGTMALGAEIAPRDLEAAVHTLGFLDTLQKQSSIHVGVVYRSGDQDAKALAQRTVGILARLKGPGGSSIDAIPLAAGDLSSLTQRLDVLYVLPGIADGARLVSDFAKRQRVVSISNDPACLNSECCVLMVRTGSNVDIVLDTSMAQATGTKFSAVFTMMVKRK